VEGKQRLVEVCASGAIPSHSFEVVFNLILPRFANGILDLRSVSIDPAVIFLAPNCQSLELFLKTHHLAASLNLPPLFWCFGSRVSP
jgi:hypothetical protein